MASSSLINSNPKVKFSDKLFFDQYRYCFRLTASYIEACRNLDHRQIDKLLELWDTHDYYVKRINFGGSWKSKPTHVPKDHAQRLHRVLRWFNGHVDQVKLQFLRDRVFVYTNDFSHFDELANLNVFTSMSITEIIQDRPRDTVKARYPGYQVRAYLKPMHITEQQRNNLIKFIDDNEFSLHTNIGLERFINLSSGRFNYLTLRDYFFIDLKDQRLLSVLEIMCPGIVRKTVDIIYDDK